MTQLDLREKERQLHKLAIEFEVLHASVRDISYTPGPDALRRIAPLLLRAQDLTATVLVWLGALSNSPYTGLIGSRSYLKCLSSVVVASSLVSNALAHALHANPNEGVPFPGGSTGDGTVRITRHGEAIVLMTGHLDKAARQLELGASECRYIAADILRTVTAEQTWQTPATRPGTDSPPPVPATKRPTL